MKVAAGARRAGSMLEIWTVEGGWTGVAVEAFRFRPPPVCLALLVLACLVLVFTLVLALVLACLVFVLALAPPCLALATTLSLATFCGLGGRLACAAGRVVYRVSRCGDGYCGSRIPLAGPWNTGVPWI